MKKGKKPIKKIGNYALMELIGKGNYADVYLSIDQKRKQAVAVKLIPRSKIEKGEEVNLNREMEILNKLKHPNIVKIINYIPSPRNFYIVLEYCNGLNLEEYLKLYKEKYKKPLNELYIQKILQQLAPALEYMHKNNIIHRDIKLQNIMLHFNSYPNILEDGDLPRKLVFGDMSLNKSFSVKIADFGFAKDIVKDKEGSTILGSPMYMSPDIVVKHLDETGKKYNTSVDLWSLGVIAYELLTGSPPFFGKNVDEVFNNIKKGVYSLPKNLKVSVEIISFINGLLQYYPEKRLNWEQINSHHFLTKNVNEFTYIDLEMVNENEKDKIQINTKDSDNLLWVLLKNNNINVNLDKINQEEIKKPEVKKVIDKTKVKNEEVEKALEKDRIEIQNEKQKIQEMKQKAEEEKKKAQLEKLNCEKEKEKIIQEENSVKTKKDELEKLIKEGTKKKDIEENTKKVEELELQLEKIKQDKNNLDNKLEDQQRKIKEKENVLKFTEKQINEFNKNDKGNDNNNEQMKKNLEKEAEEKARIENELKKLKEDQKLMEDKNKKELENLQKEIKDISEKKDNLEKEVSDKNANKQEKLKNLLEQQEKFEKEKKRIEEEHEKQIKNIQNEKENLEKQITENSQKIEKKKKEKKQEKKGIFMSCKNIDMNDVKKMEKEEEEKKKKEEEEKKGEKKDEKSEEKKDEKSEEKGQDEDSDDEWEALSLVESEDNEIDFDAVAESYELVENYIDNRMKEQKKE